LSKTSISSGSCHNFIHKHAWDVSPKEAIAIQHQLRREVLAEDRLGPVRLVAGVDVGFVERGRLSRAAVAVLSYPDLTLCAHAIAERPATFPYIPGLLSFREVPVVLEALERLDQLPDLLLCDGQGVAHPRRFGIACHLGVVTNLPAVGVAKTRLIGTHGPVPKHRGQWVPLKEGEELIGAVLRTRQGVKPLFISIGHRISLPTAIEHVVACLTRYRLPETTRWAHRFASFSF
jgi:deoxyribonuclease V